MEAVGAAAAIAQLLGLSLRAGELAQSLFTSFRNAPAEIVKLKLKMERFHVLMTQIASLQAELPKAESHVPLLSEQQVGMLSMGLENISNALLRLQLASTTQAAGSHSVRDRLRWAMLDKKKAQSLLQDTRMADSELEIMLIVLSARINSMSQNSLLALAASQSLMHADMTQSFQEIRSFNSLAASHPKKTMALASRRAMATKTDIARVNAHMTYLESHIDPYSRLIEHNMRVTRTRYVVTASKGDRSIVPTNGSYSIAANFTLEAKRKSRKAKVLFNITFKLLGQHILRFELQAQLLCRSWKLAPSINSSLTIFNLRPSDSPIFLACHNYDLGTVRYLLETGEASINDMDEETGGLIEHVVYGREILTNSLVYETAFVKGGQLLLEHLLDQGCDPSTIHGGRRKRLPALLYAFKHGYTAATSAMLSHGADLMSFYDEIGGLFDGFHHDRSQFDWQVGLLRSRGFSDWRHDGPSCNLLYGACAACNLDVGLFALEIADINPNLVGGGHRSTPMGNAAQEKWLEGIVMLLQFGALVNVNQWDWSGTPLHRSLAASSSLTDTSHYLLLRGADPGLKNFQGLSTIGQMMMAQYNPSSYWFSKFFYVAFEGSVAHLLHHGSDPFEVLTTDFSNAGEYERSWHRFYAYWFDLIGPLRISDTARLRSYGIERRRGYDGFKGEVPIGFLQQIERMEHSRSFDWKFNWNACGKIGWNTSDTLGNEESWHCAGTSVCDKENELCSEEKVTLHKRSLQNEYEIRDAGDFVPMWAYIDPEEPEWPGRLDDVTPKFFRNATSFYAHTATEDGRKQLSRWPMVRALCDGLQHAGYRVEMDDDGDLWYDCDDGDRYFDAWESQPAEERDDWLVDVCPICQNFDEYGLGHVLDIEHEAIEKVREYRRQVQEGKGKYF